MREALSPTWRLQGRARTTQFRRPQDAPLVSQHIHVHRIPHHVRDDRDTPLLSARNGTNKSLFSEKRKRNIFAYTS
jgi:hypothetical protein